MENNLWWKTILNERSRSCSEFFMSNFSSRLSCLHEVNHFFSLGEFVFVISIKKGLFVTRSILGEKSQKHSVLTVS